MTPHRWIRVTTALLAFLCGLAVWQIVALIQSTGRSTPLMVTVAAAVSITGILAAGLTIASGERVQRLVDRARQTLTVLRDRKPPDRRRVGWMLIVVGMVLYLLLINWLWSSPHDPTADDQGAYLQTAAEVHEAGGIGKLMSELFAGRFAEANRHPLYIALLSLNPTPAFGQWLSAGLGSVTLLLLTVITARWRGLLVAGVFCLLLGTNMAFCVFSIRVVCDVLMILWGGLLFRCAARDVSFRSSLMLGVLLGLAFLTKGTGTLLLAGTFVWMILLAVRRVSRSATLGKSTAQACSTVLLVVMAWTLVASPLLIRNVRRYDSPLYNVNTWLLFVDEFEQPVALAARQSAGEAAQEYWQSHTLADIARRELSGLAWETFILVRMLGPVPLDDSRVLFGVPLLICAALTILKRPRDEHLLLGIWTILFVGMFAWYVPVAAGERFLFPLLGPVLMLASEGIATLASVRVKISPPPSDAHATTPDPLA